MKAILFDYGGTLDSNGTAWQERFYSIYSDCGVRVTREDFAKAFYDADDNLHERHSLEGRNLKETLSFQIADLLEYLKIPAGGLVAEIRDRFLSDSRKFTANSKQLLKNLKKDFKMGIVSNFYGNLEAVLEGEGLLEFFETVADSTRLGVTKPDPRIFKAALDALGAAPSEAMMVGDSLGRDIRGAESMGMAHAWLYGDRFETGKPAPCCGSGLILKNLQELKEASVIN